MPKLFIPGGSQVLMFVVPGKDGFGVVLDLEAIRTAPTFNPSTPVAAVVYRRACTYKVIDKFES